MNKLLKSIVAASVGVAMAIGVGVSFGNEAKEVVAAGETWASNVDTFELATSIADGDEIIIASSYAANAMGTQTTNNRSGAAITKDGDLVSNKTAVPSSANSVALVTVGVHNVGGTDYYTFAVDGGYLYDASASSKNYLRTQNSITDNGYADWTVEIDDDGVASISARAAAASSKLTLSYNAANNLFACYANLQTNGGLEIYKKVAATSVVDTVSASIKSGTYYTGTTLSSSNFNVNVTWTNGPDTQPTDGFTWTVNGAENGKLIEGDNSVVVTYGGIDSPAFNVVGTSIHATSLVIDESASPVSIMVGHTVTLHCTLAPENAVDTISSWSSSEEDIATVEDGIVTAVAVGSTTITATASNGVSGTCTINVVEETYKEALFGADYNVNVNGYENEWSSNNCGFVVDVVNANNNNNGWNGAIAIGKKETAGTASITTHAPIANPISSVILDIVKADSGMTSIELFTSADGNDWAFVDEFTYSVAEQEIEIDSPTANLYYRILFTFDLSEGNSNGICRIDSVKYIFGQAQEQTPEEQVQGLKTQASLSYNYSVSDSVTLTDTLDRDFTGVEDGSTTYTDWGLAKDMSLTSGIAYAGQSAGDNDSIQIRSKNSNSGIIAIDNPTSYVVKKVTLTWQASTANNRVVEIYGKNTAYAAASDLYSNDTKGTLIGTLTYNGSSESSITISDSYKYVGIRSGDGAIYLESVEIQWGTLPVYSLSSVAIRFGGFMSKALWDELENIQGYGVMLSATEDLEGAKLNASNKQFDLFVDSKPNPTLANASQKQSMGATDVNADYYVWTLRVNVAEGYYKTSITAVAYIKTSAGYIYFQETAKSAKELAGELLASGSDTYEGSLNYLASL